MKRLALAGAACILCLTRPAHAQTSAELLARGMRAAQNLDYDSAGTMLRAALARVGTDVLPDSSRRRALMFLGATEFFTGRRDSAVAVFGRLIALDPRYRPDQLVFPPEISSLFQEVRAGTRAVAVVVPPTTELASAGDRWPVRLYATSLHDITTTLHRGSGNMLPARTLYTGAIGDSLELLWDGKDSLGAVADSGAWTLRVESRGPTGRVARIVEVPLDVRVARHDTLSWPPPVADSLLRPEQIGAGGAPRALAGGLVAAAAVLILPSVVSSGSSPSSGRYAVAAATSLAGIIGWIRGRHPQPLPENIAANQVLRTAWQRGVDTVRNENAARRSDARIVIRAGAARVVP